MLLSVVCVCVSPLYRSNGPKYAVFQDMNKTGFEQRVPDRSSITFLKNGSNILIIRRQFLVLIFPNETASGIFPMALRSAL
jgi:hypothetical protein